MRIAILSQGRFHVAELARLLAERGHEVTFYSDVPAFRLKKFGMQRVRTVTIWPATLLRVLESITKNRLGIRRLRLTETRNRVMDTVCSFFIRECDVVISMAGVAPASASRAQKRFGAKWWLERSSQHIEGQKRILNNLPKDSYSESVSEWQVQREKFEYENCDKIVVPSHHVWESFVKEGVDSEKLWINPLGVVLPSFPFTPVRSDTPPTLIMVGNWSRQKGCQLLISAWSKLANVRLMHAGSSTDLEIPSQTNFLALGQMDQSQLWEAYGNAHVLVLPSYQDGFGVVISQALACGLLVVCSDRTGAADIKKRFPKPDRIAIFKNGDEQGLRIALERQLQSARTERNIEIPRSLLHEALAAEAHAERYHQELVGGEAVKTSVVS